MMNRFRSLQRMLLANLFLAQSIPFVCAQHVDVLVFDDGGKVGVGEFNFENPGISDKRVHLAGFDGLYSVNNPGFVAFAGPDSLPGNQDLRWDFLPMTVDSGPHAGYRSTLLYWDGTGGSPAFGPTLTDDYEFSLFGRDAPATADGGAEIVPGDVITQTPPNGALHEHRFYYLDDNGDGLNTTIPAAGIYVVGMRLLIEGLEHSDPLFMVWSTPEVAVLPAIQPSAAWVNDRVDSLFIETPIGDFNEDGDVDGADFLDWQRSPTALGGADSLTQWELNYGMGTAVPASLESVPEPASLHIFVCWLALSQLFLPRRRVCVESV